MADLEQGEKGRYNLRHCQATENYEDLDCVQVQASTKYKRDWVGLIEYPIFYKMRSRSASPAEPEALLTEAIDVVDSHGNIVLCHSATMSAIPHPGPIHLQSIHLHPPHPSWGKVDVLENEVSIPSRTRSSTGKSQRCIRCTWKHHVMSLCKQYLPSISRPGSIHLLKNPPSLPITLGQAGFNPNFIIEVEESM